MYLFWFIPVLLIALLAFWAFYSRVVNNGRSVGRTDGETLSDRSGSGGSRG